jgi:nucleotide-binding universal stress UspA family protein
MLKAANRESIRAERMAIAQFRIEQAMSEFSAACEAAGIKHQVIEETGDPFATLISLSRYHDVMVFGLKSVLEYDFLVSDPESLLIRLVSAGVRPLIAVSENFRPIARVLIAYSGSMESAKAMKRFIQMQLWPISELRIISFEDGKGHARELLADAANYCRAHGLDVETECVAGSPKELLLPYIRTWGADITVVGNSSQNLILRCIFGETALHVIRNADQPLFLAQ